ncbi:unnamed protein product [Ectocarpus sp. CCAP 1310/34]|nr:unnamed protein product [Ectocarpus sp. CCAP 1310/34]
MHAEGLNARGGRGRSIVDGRWRGGRKDHRGDGGCGWNVVEGEHLRVVGSRYRATEPGTGWVGERACARGG